MKWMITALIVCGLALPGADGRADTLAWQGSFGWGRDAFAYVPVPAASYDYVVLVAESNFNPESVQVFRAGPGQDANDDLVIPDPDPLLYRFFGTDVSNVGDVNGDGQPDFVVSAPVTPTSYEATTPGGFFLYHGGPGMDAVADLEALLWAGTHRNIGFSCIGGGDWNGDGYDDFAISAYSDAAGPAALVYFGGPALDAEPDLVIDGIQIDDRVWYKWGLMDADFNGDGYADLAGNLADGTGRIGIFLGSPAPDNVVDIAIATDITHINNSIGAGDVDLDGYDDLVILAVDSLVVHRGGATVSPEPTAVFRSDPDRFHLHQQGLIEIVRTDLNEDHADIFVSTRFGDHLIAFDGGGVSTATPEFLFLPQMNPGSEVGHHFTLAPGVGPGGTDGIFVMEDIWDIGIYTDLILDHDRDGIPDAEEIVAGTLEDCDANGLPDLAEILLWPALDCDVDATLDFCQLASEDCDNDGVVDACTIASYPWLDCNDNGVLDSCEPLTPDMDMDGNGLTDCSEIHANVWLDCDGNGILDHVQHEGTDLDCDNDGYTDFCAINRLNRPDCNLDLIPDDCQVDIAGYDVDGDDVLDVCAVAGDLDEDCDGNGRMDFWDIAYHPADDCDRDGFLDACDAEPAGYPCGSMPWLGIYFDAALTQTDMDPADLPDFGHLWVAVRGLEPGEATAVDHYSFSIVAPGELAIGGGVLEPEGGATDVAAANDEFWVTVDGELAADANGDLLLARVVYFKTGTPAAGTGIRALGVEMSEISNRRPVWRDAVTGDHRVIDSRAAYFGAGFPDCNHNGQDDALDIAGNISPDDNGDGIPDECQLSDTRVPGSVALALDAAPNPFNPRTTVAYAVPAAGHVRLEVYDVSGRRIRTLWNGHAEAGPGTVIWHGRDDAGSAVASGVYFLRMESAQGHLTRKLALLR